VAHIKDELAGHAASLASGSIKSYGTAISTGGVSFWARMSQDIADWSALDLITVAGIVFGIVYGGIRAYRDVSELLDRKWADDENGNDNYG
jgi:hypothetical protein